MRFDIVTLFPEMPLLIEKFGITARAAKLGLWQLKCWNPRDFVFDAYKIKKNVGSFEKNDNIYVVYTKEAQTADNYIEKVTHDLAQNYRVYVATSDALEQTIVSSF